MISGESTFWALSRSPLERQPPFTPRTGNTINKNDATKQLWVIFFIKNNPHGMKILSKLPADISVIV